MKKTTVYLDTSVINFLYADDIMDICPKNLAMIAKHNYARPAEPLKYD
jgi:hypothetical protein